MLNIGRMAPGRADYYLTAVAKQDGVEGYYLAHGEEPGRWLGTGAETLGLSGEVTGEELRAVLDARHPDSGVRLATLCRIRHNGAYPESRIMPSRPSTAGVSPGQRSGGRDRFGIILVGC